MNRFFEIENFFIGLRNCYYTFRIIYILITEFNR